MLYKIDFTTRNEREAGTKWVNFAANKVEGTKRFMDWFFAKHPDDAVRIDNLTEVNIVGDMSAVDLIDDIAREEQP